MRFHPFAEIFPLLDSTGLAELAEDIQANGLRERIWLYRGKILDGRNRYLACEKAKVKPDYQEYTGDDPLAFILSLNVHRRHLSESQRAMAAARIATLKLGANQHEGAPMGAPSQSEAAERMDVSRRSVQRASQILEHGSKALQHAVENGEVPVRRAAEVIELPKSEQLAAAKEKPVVVPVEIPDHWEPDVDEIQKMEIFEREHAASIDKIMAADDRLGAAHLEIKRLTEMNALLTISRNGYQNKCGELIRRIKSLQRENDRLKRQAA